MQTIKIENIEIPMTKELEEFFRYRYQNQATKLVDEFLLYLNTKKEAYEVNKALQEVQQGKTNDIGKLFDEL
ncbi:MAG: hypothetical protein K0U38_01030 [Epsilonproteobacteria bacterium]|nr:hypothetical protein [Campylobacterota bacterium]